MLGTKGEVLYVGKAKALKRRVASYTRPEGLPLRLQRMIAETAAMEFIVAKAMCMILPSRGRRRIIPLSARCSSSLVGSPTRNSSGAMSIRTCAACMLMITHASSLRLRGTQQEAIQKTLR
jgi:hypothetical protein